MAGLLYHRATAVWLVLVGATALSWEFGHGFGFGTNLRYAAIAVIVIAFIKARLVILEFMELRHAPVALRAALEGWGLITCAAIIALYWSGG